MNIILFLKFLKYEKKESNLFLDPGVHRKKSFIPVDTG